MEQQDVVVVGAGAAGLNAALVLARSRRRVLVVDGGAPRNQPAEHMHGYLSRDGLPPSELLEIGRTEVRGYGVEVVSDSVLATDQDDDGFTLELARGGRVHSHRLIVATGVTDELPEIPGLRERWGRDVLHCPYCHGWEVRDQPIGVLGNEHQALLIRQLSSDVVFFGPSSPALVRRGIQVVDAPVREVLVREDRLVGVRLWHDQVVERSALFVASRMVANDTVLRDLKCEFGENGLVLTDPTGRTSVPGVWAAGNVRDPMAQVIVAAGQGSQAGMAVNNDLVEQESR